MKNWHRRIKSLMIPVIATMVMIPLFSRGDIEVDFPWGKEVSFPWKEIEGTWNYEKLNGKFEFIVVSDEESGNKVVRVSEYDYDNHLKAQGVGIADEDMKIVRAVMQSGDGAYLLLIRAAVVKAEECSTGKLMVVITVRSMNPSSQTRDRHYVINKETNELPCVVDQSATSP